MDQDGVAVGQKTITELGDAIDRTCHGCVRLLKPSLEQCRRPLGIVRDAFSQDESHHVHDPRLMQRSLPDAVQLLAQFSEAHRQSWLSIAPAASELDERPAGQPRARPTARRMGIGKLQARPLHIGRQRRDPGFRHQPATS